MEIDARLITKSHHRSPFPAPFSSCRSTTRLYTAARGPGAPRRLELRCALYAKIVLEYDRIVEIILLAFFALFDYVLARYARIPIDAEIIQSFRIYLSFYFPFIQSPPPSAPTTAGWQTQSSDHRTSVTSLPVRVDRPELVVLPAHNVPPNHAWFRLRSPLSQLCPQLSGSLM